MLVKIDPQLAQATPLRGDAPPRRARPMAASVSSAPGAGPPEWEYLPLGAMHDQVHCFEGATLKGEHCISEAKNGFSQRAMHFAEEKIYARNENLQKCLMKKSILCLFGVLLQTPAPEKNWSKNCRKTAKTSKLLCQEFQISFGY